MRLTTITARTRKAIEVVFDPSKLSHRELLEFFFQIHDPTTKCTALCCARIQSGVAMYEPLFVGLG